MKVSDDLQLAIKKAIEELGSQEALASASGVPRPNISAYVCGRVVDMRVGAWQKLKPFILKHLPPDHLLRSEQTLIQARKRATSAMLQRICAWIMSGEAPAAVLDHLADTLGDYIDDFKYQPVSGLEDAVHRHPMLTEKQKREFLIKAIRLESSGEKLEILKRLLASPDVSVDTLRAVLGIGKKDE